MLSCLVAEGVLVTQHPPPLAAHSGPSPPAAWVWLVAPILGHIDLPLGLGGQHLLCLGCEGLPPGCRGLPRSVAAAVCIRDKSAASVDAWEARRACHSSGRSPPATVAGTPNVEGSMQAIVA